MTQSNTEQQEPTTPEFINDRAKEIYEQHDLTPDEKIFMLKNL